MLAVVPTPILLLPTTIHTTIPPPPLATMLHRSAMTNGTPSSRPPPEDVAPMADPSTAWSKQAPPVYVEPSSERFKDLNASMVKWFKNRGISNLTLKRNRVQYEVCGGGCVMWVCHVGVDIVSVDIVGVACG